MHMLRAFLLALLLIAPASAQQRTNDVLRVMSFNVRLPIDKGEKSWEARLPVAIAMLKRTQPDIIGTQELHRRQGNDIVRALPVYAWIGLDRRGGHDDEHMGLFYRRDRLRLIRFGNFWLSDTPDIPGSISWGHPYPRMATWAEFETMNGKRRFYAFNTHLPYRAEDDAAREKGAALLVRKIAEIAADVPVVITGDFNTGPESKAHAALTERFADARLTAPARSGPDATFHNFTGRADRRIDWIVSRGLSARAARTITDHRGPVQTSDHFPVLAELAFNRPE